MAKEITVEEAIKIIEKYPDEDSFISENYVAKMGMHNEFTDNSIELSDYYSECKSIVKDHLHHKHG